VPEDDGRMLARSFWFHEETGDASFTRARVIDSENSSPRAFFQLFLLQLERLPCVVCEQLPLRIRDLGRADCREEKEQKKNFLRLEITS
jgi:hypothetical protein